MSDTTDRPYLDGVPQEVQDLIYQGQKIQAIKLLRAIQPELDLKAAKEQVDELADQLSGQFPEAFTAQGKSGCGSAMLSVAVVVAVTLYFVAHAL